MGKALAGGSGWVLLAWSPRLGRLTNQWAPDHAHCLGDGAIVLALDMYEHAYHMDFGAKAGEYVDAFMGNIAWERAEQRLDQARKISPSSPALPPGEVSVAELQAMLNRGEEIIILDVRLDEDLAKAADTLPGALRRKPEEVGIWANDLPGGRSVVAFCVYGFHVSRDAVAAMRDKGVNARSLSGGVAAWRACGGSTVPKQ